MFTITYSDKTGSISIYMIVQDYKNSKNKIASQDFMIDCHGGCDCREKFFPDTGAIECTCADCQMDVHQI